MIRIAISQAAFDAIASTLPPGSTGYENAVNEKGERRMLDKLNSYRRAACCADWQAKAEESVNILAAALAHVTVAVVTKSNVSDKSHRRLFSQPPSLRCCHRSGNCGAYDFTNLVLRSTRQTVRHASLSSVTNLAMPVSIHDRPGSP
jgi:hypothetical protein